MPFHRLASNHCCECTGRQEEEEEEGAWRYVWRRGAVAVRDTATCPATCTAICTATCTAACAAACAATLCNTLQHSATLCNSDDVGLLLREIRPVNVSVLVHKCIGLFCRCIGLFCGNTRNGGAGRVDIGLFCGCIWLFWGFRGKKGRCLGGEGLSRNLLSFDIIKHRNILILHSATNPHTNTHTHTNVCTQTLRDQHILLCNVALQSTHTQTEWLCLAIRSNDHHPFSERQSFWHGVATISRLLKILGLFCRI